MNQNRISLITALKNRKEHLEKTLPNWLKFDQIDQIVILDWDSNDDPLSIVEKYDDGRIDYIHVSNQSEWILSRAYNLAAQFAKYTHLLKLDADISIQNEFFEKYKLSPGIFFAGNWECAKNINDMALSGSFFVSKNDFLGIGGFDERITSYGFDDNNLYNRLEIGSIQYQILRVIGLISYILRKIGVINIPNDNTRIYNKKNKRIDISPDTLSHIPHSDELRIRHQKLKLKTFHKQIRKNKYKSITVWTAKSKKKEYKIIETSERRYEATPKN